MRTAELTGALLDYWVLQAGGVDLATVIPNGSVNPDVIYPISPSTNWAQCGPLIDKHHICVRPGIYDDWVAAAQFEPLGDTNLMSHGDTPQEAICRAVVRAKFGDEVPEVQS